MYIVLNVRVKAECDQEMMKLLNDEPNDASFDIKRRL